MNRTEMDRFENLSTISAGENAIRNRHLSVYKHLVTSFFEDLDKLQLLDSELRSVPSLFLPSCGKRYDQASIKIAVIGESTLRWNEDLRYDLDHFKDGSYWNDNLGYFASFYLFQNKDEGPVNWKNNFWIYHAQVLEALLDQKGAFDMSNPVFSQIAWGNCWCLEQYKNGTGVDLKNISLDSYRKISYETMKLRISGLEYFVEVFSPDIILYTCKNNYGSDYIFPPSGKENLSCEQPKRFQIFARKYKSTLIVQTWHPSYLKRFCGVSEQEFGESMQQAIKELM